MAGSVAVLENCKVPSVNCKVQIEGLRRRAGVLAARHGHVLGRWRLLPSPSYPTQPSPCEGLLLVAECVCRRRAFIDLATGEISGSAVSRRCTDQAKRRGAELVEMIRRLRR
jgi:hypothetical protein